MIACRHVGALAEINTDQIVRGQVLHQFIGVRPFQLPLSEYCDISHGCTCPQATVFDIRNPKICRDTHSIAFWSFLFDAASKNGRWFVSAISALMDTITSTGNGLSFSTGKSNLTVHGRVAKSRPVAIELHCRRAQPRFVSELP